uniref:invasion associated locus B family protein n=1 Tax=Parerythrobacter lutipelagi TaxID=1964208 RepID=UPI0010F80D80|nr:invasion associated locus B family protein [Parerythrobacter lutipelagi]
MALIGRIRRIGLGAAVLTLLCVPAVAPARDSLGVFSDWGAFRDSAVPRCYAIAKPSASRAARTFDPFASVGTWPRRKVRNQLHIRLSRKTAVGSAITLRIGSRDFALTGSGGNAWARDRSMDAAIVAAMRSASRMTVSARDENGRSFSNRYNLAGAATAMDAATVGCARIR